MKHTMMSLFWWYLTCGKFIESNGQANQQLTVIGYIWVIISRQVAVDKSI
jgi:hypothetical protein